MTITLMSHDISFCSLNDNDKVFDATVFATAIAVALVVPATAVAVARAAASHLPMKFDFPSRFTLIKAIN